MRTLAPCLVCGRDVATDTRPVVCYDCQERDISTQDMRMGQAWRENSSLSKWFPFTATELQNMKDALKKIAALCPELKHHGGIDDSDHWSAEHRELIRRVGKIARENITQ